MAHVEPGDDRDEIQEQHRGADVMRRRFLVCHPDDGFVSSHPTRLEAQRAAIAWEPKSGYMPLYRVEVYDRLARVGRPNCWRAAPGGQWEVVGWKADPKRITKGE